MDADALHHRARTKGVNPLVYWPVRWLLIPFFRLYFRLGRKGREHIPATGPLLLAANHRSFLDPFVLGTMVKRPVYYVAKRELFANRLQGWLLNALGAFPVDRGAGDQAMLDTARAILERGDCVLIFPEGTRVRPGGLGTPKRGVGRLALESGAPVVPLAVLGTERVRRGWRIRPHRVTIRAGRPLTFPRVEQPSRGLAQAVTDRIWPCVALQWEWLGGLAPLRRAAVVGAGAWGTSLAVTLQRAGLEVQLGTRTREQARDIAERGENPRLPGVELDGITVTRTADLDLDAADLVLLAVPSRALPHVLAANGHRIPARAGVVVLSKGLVGPLGALPSAFVSERVPARAIACVGGPGHAHECLRSGASLVVAGHDEVFTAQLVQILAAAGIDARRTADLIGVELAGIAKNAAALAAAAASHAGPNAAGAAAGKVWAELGAYAQSAGAKPATLHGLAGTGDLVATVLAAGSRNRRAGELLGGGLSAGEIDQTLGETAEALDTLPLLAQRLRAERSERRTVEGLAALVAGETTAQEWLAQVVSPAGRPHAAAA
jgi:1-acyl-sn-glycerol-3-phosphate acyltransferase